MKKNILLIALLIILVFVVILSCSIGAERIPFNIVQKLLLNKIPIIKNYIDVSDIKESYKTIIYVARIPRVIAGLLIGMALSGSGVVFQGVLRNPLAEPYVLGISSGAALGATLVIISNMSFNILGFSATSIGALIMALITVFIVYIISSLFKRESNSTLLLSGIAIGSFFSACVSLIIALNGDKLQKIIFWTMGSLSPIKNSHIKVVSLPLIICILFFMYFSKELNLMLLGDDTAKSLGMNVEFKKKLLLFIATIATSLAVSISGIIGFVGLIAPHSMRLIFGPNHKKLLPATLLFGGIFLIVSDTIARTIISPSQLPIGVITAFIGAPYFLFLLYRHSKIEGVR